MGIKSSEVSHENSSQQIVEEFKSRANLSQEIVEEFQSKANTSEQIVEESIQRLDKRNSFAEDLEFSKNAPQLESIEHEPAPLNYMRK